MRVTSKGQVTIPRNVRESMGILSAETETEIETEIEFEFEFEQDESGHWYITKIPPHIKKTSRFRTAHKTGKLTMTANDIMALTRSEAWPSS